MACALPWERGACKRNRSRACAGELLRGLAGTLGNARKQRWRREHLLDAIQLCWTTAGKRLERRILPHQCRLRRQLVFVQPAPLLLD